MHHRCVRRQSCCTRCTTRRWSGELPRQDAAHGRGPPLAAALRGRNSCGVEVAGDLTETLAERVLMLDAAREFLGNSRGATKTLRPRARLPGWLGVFSEV